MKRFISIQTKAPIQITTLAWTKITEILNEKNAYGFMFSAKSGGCNGFNYNLKLINTEDEILKHLSESSKNISSLISPQNSKVFVDPTSEMFLLGTTIDYVNEDYDQGLFENKFIFLPNDKLATSCGCGISFTPRVT